MKTFILITVIASLGIVNFIVNILSNGFETHPLLRSDISVIENHRKLLSESSSLSLQSNTNVLNDDSMIAHSIPITDEFIQSIQSPELVLGIAEAIDPKNLAIFIASFRSSNPSATIIIFVSTKDKENTFINIISNQYNVHLLTYDRTKLYPNFLQTYHSSSLRWIFYYQLLSNNQIKNKINKVIMIDIRDTAFQTNPFQLDIFDKKQLAVFKESRVLSIGQCKWNSGWIRDCFSGTILSYLLDDPISCSGVILGDIDLVYKYIYIMNRILTGQSDISHNFPQCERNGVDQGIHNVIIGLELVSPIVSYFDDENLIINLQQSAVLQSMKRAINTDTNQLFSYRFDTPYSIVHQYDRSTELSSLLAKKYIDWVDISDPVKEFKQLDTCNHKYDLLISYELFPRKCDISNHRTLTVGSCCEICTNTNECTAFTYIDGVCFLKSCTVSLPFNDNDMRYNTKNVVMSAYNLK